VANNIVTVGSEGRGEILASLLDGTTTTTTAGTPNDDHNNNVNDHDNNTKNSSSSTTTTTTRRSKRGFVTHTGTYNGVPVSIVLINMGYPNMDFRAGGEGGDDGTAPHRPPRVLRRIAPRPARRQRGGCERGLRDDSPKSGRLGRDGRERRNPRRAVPVPRGGPRRRRAVRSAAEGAQALAGWQGGRQRRRWRDGRGGMLECLGGQLLQQPRPSRPKLRRPQQRYLVEFARATPLGGELRDGDVSAAAPCSPLSKEQGAGVGRNHSGESGGEV
ncbi:unnamed protein product, partial [Ectocarpus sp. 8 AP-2014]